MFDFEIQWDTKVEGSTPHPLVKIGGAMAGFPFVMLGNYFPLASALKLIVINIPNPVQQFPWWTWLIAATFLLGLFTIGSHCIAGMTRWLSGECLSSKQCYLVVAVISTLSLAVATTTLVLAQWNMVMLAGFVAMFVLPLAAGPIIWIGQVLAAR